MKVFKIFLCVLTVVTGGMTVMADSLSIGQRFHFETSYGDEGIKGKDISYGKQTLLYKEYENSIKIKLPAPVKTSMLLETALENRKSDRNFTEREMTIEQLSRLLLSGDGITHKKGGIDMRSAPSGGALYPVEIYLIVSNVDGLDPGLYHYLPVDTSLELIKQESFDSLLHIASFEQKAVGSSPISLILTARFNRSTVKYADRGYRYAYMEAGAICQNIYLQATALGLGTVAVGAFNDDRINDLLATDGINEAVLLIMPVGYLT